MFGTLWAYWKLREISDRQGGRIDWWGNLTFAFGLGAILVGVTYGIQPYGHQPRAGRARPSTRSSSAAPSCWARSW